MSKLEEVIAFAQAAHAGQEYDGKDYFLTHVTDVAMRVASDPGANDKHIMAAYLHDVLEDCDVRAGSMAVIVGYENWDVLLAVVSLTKFDGLSYEEYMQGVVKDPIAALVKYHDSAANYAYGQRPKYKKNMEFLLPYLPKESVEYLKNSS